MLGDRNFVDGSKRKGVLLILVETRPHWYDWKATPWSLNVAQTTFIYRKTYYIMIVSSNFFGGSMKSHYAAVLLCFLGCIGFRLYWGPVLSPPEKSSEHKLLTISRWQKHAFRSALEALVMPGMKCLVNVIRSLWRKMSTLIICVSDVLALFVCLFDCLLFIVCGVLFLLCLLFGLLFGLLLLLSLLSLLSLLLLLLLLLLLFPPTPRSRAFFQTYSPMEIGCLCAFRTLGVRFRASGGGGCFCSRFVHWMIHCMIYTLHTCPTLRYILYTCPNLM